MEIEKRDRFDCAIILAGGAGTRLWPRSHDQAPKYLMRIASARYSLLQQTIMRAAEVCNERIVIVTHEPQVSLILEEIAGLPEIEQRLVLLAEPEPKNTAMAIALAIRYFFTHEDARHVICLPADHLISPLSSFTADALLAAKSAHLSHIVTFGIRPHQPLTGYGYIERGKPCETGYKIKQFHEKPDRATAERYIADESFFWNSGIYAFSTMRMWLELMDYAGDIIRALDRQAAGYFQFRDHVTAHEGHSVSHTVRVQQVHPKTRALYAKAPSISIDYAIAENSEYMLMCEAHFNWNDIGSWDEVARLVDKKEIDIAHEGEQFLEKSANNVIISDKRVALCGINDIIIVTQGDTILICKRGYSQYVKKIAMSDKRRGEKHDRQDN